MKTLSRWMLFSVVVTLASAGCSNGPSPEQQTREQQDARETAKKQADFFNSPPPPPSQPGR